MIKNKKINTIALALSIYSQISFSSTGIIHAEGNTLKTDAGVNVELKGFNLGSLFPLEHYMSPAGKIGIETVDTYNVMLTMEKRFGVEKQRDLISCYQNSWITSLDFENIKMAGFNVVRIPVWWGQFYDLNNTSESGWRKDAFTQLDRIVNSAALKKIYVIIDMHGAVGGQSLNISTGQKGLNIYWSDTAAARSTASMWKKIADHYKDNPYIAGYDLLNEPDPRPNKETAWSGIYTKIIINAYDELYKNIRSVDKNHTIFIEDTFYKWNLDMLPDPTTMGWTNVAYEAHVYPWPANALPGETHIAEAKRGIDSVVRDFSSHASWKVPGYIGEFNPLENSSETWNYAIQAFNSSSLSWTAWSYKSSNGKAPNHWGWYVRTGWPGEPDLLVDSAADIQNKWSRWKTTDAFERNISLGIRP